MNMSQFMDSPFSFPFDELNMFPYALEHFLRSFRKLTRSDDQFAGARPFTNLNNKQSKVKQHVERGHHGDLPNDAT